MSLYLSQPGVPRVRIGTYPKRRKSGVERPSGWSANQFPTQNGHRDDVRYLEFFSPIDTQMVQAS